MVVIKQARALMAAGIALAGLMATAPARADDPTIPPECRSVQAEDDDRCADIIAARFVARNVSLNKRDQKANEAIRKRILATTTRSGETFASAFEYTRTHIPFVVEGFHFVYARSGAEYAVLEYDSKAEPQKPPDEMWDDLSLFDDDRDSDPLMGTCNSSALGFVVWKIQDKSIVPCGSYANMLSLGQQAFVWAVNEGRRGFKDSGFQKDVMANFGFLDTLEANGQKISAIVSPEANPGLTFYWNIREGYVFQSDSLGCPPKQVGDFLFRGKDCEALAAAAQDIAGQVLPFKIIRALRNHEFVAGMVEAQVSVSVEGGTPGDWVATAIYVAEHSMVRDVTFVEAEVYVPNPWADFPPQHSKLLAKVYYGPDPARSPWKEPWGIFAAKHAGSLAEIEYDVLANDLIDDPAKTPNPIERLQKAEQAAKREVIAKYGLSKTWEPRDDVGLDGQGHDREHIRITDGGGLEPSLTALRACLTTNQPSPLVSGCKPQ